MTAVLILFVCTIAIAYTCYLHLCQKEHMHQWITSLLSTIISVILGVLTGIAVFTYQNGKDTENKRQQLLELVRLELSTNAEYLTHEGYSLQIGTTQWKFFSTPLDHSAIDAAALSGIFTGRQAKDLLLLSGNIRFYNSIIDSADRLYTVTPLPYRIAMARHLYENQQKSHSAMRPNLLACQKDLGLQ